MTGTATTEATWRVDTGAKTERIRQWKPSRKGAPQPENRKWGARRGEVASDDGNLRGRRERRPGGPSRALQTPHFPRPRPASLWRGGVPVLSAALRDALGCGTGCQAWMSTPARYANLSSAAPRPPGSRGGQLPPAAGEGGAERAETRPGTDGAWGRAARAEEGGGGRWGGGRGLPRRERWPRGLSRGGRWGLLRPRHRLWVQVLRRRGPGCPGVPMKRGLVPRPSPKLRGRGGAWPHPPLPAPHLSCFSRQASGGSGPALCTWG